MKHNTISLIQHKLDQQKIEGLHYQVSLDELSIYVTSEIIVRLLNFMRDDYELAFKQLIDICAVDYLGRQPRFEVVYHLLSLKLNARVRIKISIEEETPIPSVVNIYSAANWFEREIFDLYGLSFKDHPDLRRILTDYHFQGHPLRKDFPLTGYLEPIYDEVQKKVIYNPVDLPQAYRDFDFLSPWQGMAISSSQILPGDEKAQTSNPLISDRSK